MKTLPRGVEISFFLLFFLFFGCAETGMNEGEAMPDLALYDMEGNRAELLDYIRHDGLLLLHFWGAACCQTYSEQTLLVLSKINSLENSKNMTVVSVNLDYSEDRVRRIIGNLNITQTMLNDKDSSFYRAQPKMKYFFPLCLILVVDGNGVIQGRMMGPQLLPAINDLISQAKAEGGKKR